MCFSLSNFSLLHIPLAAFQYLPLTGDARASNKTDYLPDTFPAMWNFTTASRSLLHCLSHTYKAKNLVKMVDKNKEGHKPDGNRTTENTTQQLIPHISLEAQMRWWFSTPTSKQTSLHRRPSNRVKVAPTEGIQHTVTSDYSYSELQCPDYFYLWSRKMGSFTGGHQHSTPHSFLILSVFQKGRIKQASSWFKTNK